MTAHVLITGVIFRAPESRTSKAGKPFWTATIKAKGDDALTWWKIIVFSESAGAELLRLSDGDAVSVQGALRVETYDKDGMTKVSLTCIADAVLPLRAAPKERKAEVTNARKAEKSKDECRSSDRSSARSEKPAPDRDRLDRHGCDGSDRFGDEIPF
jgi:single-stranded DNA-binding protein